MELIKQNAICNKIFTVRNIQVMLDNDLAIIYQTETKFINRAVKRNPMRFPKEFMFQLNDEEWENLKCQIGTSSEHGGRRTLPFVFSEQGVTMLSAVLNTNVAINASIQIIQAFVSMRNFLLNNASIFQRLDKLELKLLKTDESLEQIFKALEAGKPALTQGVFFDGQVFDAYAFASGLIKKAKSQIILIDNYIDETTLIHLSKKQKQTKVLLLTKNISKTLLLDIKKANEQFGNFDVSSFNASHDRFLILDQSEIYHLGASLKDLGKKWFAFSILQKHLLNMILMEIKKEIIL
jgi:hypothetical protein